MLSLLLPSLLIMFIPSTFKRPVSSWKALNLRKTLLMASSVRLKPLNCSRLPCVYAQETLTFLLTQKKTDRKSGSAGMPRPISYAVFCLKKKKYTSKSKQRSITANCIAQFSLRNDKYGGCSQSGLQLQKGSLTLVKPSEWNPLPGEASKRSNKPRKIPHESPRVACKS